MIFSLPRRQASGFGLPLAACLLFLFFSAPAQADIYRLHGTASWYGSTRPDGRSAQGLRTANGELFNRNALTAAHRTLPFNTVVRVRNLKNDKDVLVRITDRGPYIKKRVVDVSRRAAELLGMLDAGLVPVAVEVVGSEDSLPLNPDKGFYLLLAKTRDAQEAHRIGADLHAKLDMRIRSFVNRSNGPTAYYLYTGPYDTFRCAEEAFLRAEQKEATLGVIEGPRLLPSPANRLIAY